MIATTASMIEQFNLHNIKLLKSLGANVHIATNFNNPGTITVEKSSNLIKKLEKENVTCHQVDFCRGIGNFTANKKALKQVCDIIKENNISGIHAHSPLGGIIGRRAAHKMKIKIIYTAHGLQFFKGGPLRDWLFFFPVEWFYAHWTDVLVTINEDDYRISKFLPVKRRYYIPGVGTDIKRTLNINEKEKNNLRKKTRKKLGISNKEYLVVSVGELSKRKNHATVLRAIKKINDPQIKYVIAGIGKERKKLINLIKSLQLEKQVQLLGYVDDLDGLYYAADLNVFVSTREGLGLGGVDGIAHGLYIIGNGKTGMKDYISNEEVGMLVNNPLDVDELVEKIKVAKHNYDQIPIGQIPLEFDHSYVDNIMLNIYKREFNL